MNESHAREAAITGAVWLIMNRGLDIIAAVGRLDTPIGEYIVAPGLRYLMIPIMVIPAGIIADRALERTGN